MPTLYLSGHRAVFCPLRIVRGANDPAPAILAHRDAAGAGVLFLSHEVDND